MGVIGRRGPRRPHISAVARIAALLSVALGASGSTATNSAADHPSPGLPFVINTWSGVFTAATDTAFIALANTISSSPTSTTLTHPHQQLPRLPLHYPSSLLSPAGAALDALTLGLATCEAAGCDGTVGAFGSRDESCETTLDALLMDGSTFATGAVGGLRRVADAVSVARHVLDYTRHSLLVGDGATAFAVEMGFEEKDVSRSGNGSDGGKDGGESGDDGCAEWRRQGCPGNFRRNVIPDPTVSCGPYRPIRVEGDFGDAVSPGQHLQLPWLSASRQDDGVVAAHEERPLAGHDTISMVAITANRSVAAGTSTNGALHKVPGRVGDGPIVGSGAYADSDVGGCGATGDGDVMLRFLPCYQAVESLRHGLSPAEAAEDAVRRMVRKFPGLHSGIVVVDRDGRHAGAASGWTFTYSFRGGNMERTEVVTVPPIVLDTNVDRREEMSLEEL